MFYPLNYGNNGICDLDLRLPIANGAGVPVQTRWWFHFGEAPCEMIMPEGDSNSLTVCLGLMRD